MADRDSSADDEKENFFDNKSNQIKSRERERKREMFRITTRNGKCSKRNIAIDYYVIKVAVTKCWRDGPTSVRTTVQHLASIVDEAADHESCDGGHRQVVNRLISNPTRLNLSQIVALIFRFARFATVFLYTPVQCFRKTIWCCCNIIICYFIFLLGRVFLQSRRLSCVIISGNILFVYTEKKGKVYYFPFSPVLS